MGGLYSGLEGAAYAVPDGGKDNIYYGGVFLHMEILIRTAKL